MSFERLPATILRALGDRVGVPEERPSFMQGLAVGALVGAAIAGSTLWNRMRHRADEAPVPRRIGEGTIGTP